MLWVSAASSSAVDGIRKPFAKGDIAKPKLAASQKPAKTVQIARAFRPITAFYAVRVSFFQAVLASARGGVELVAEVLHQS